MTQAEPPVGRLGAPSIDCPNPTELADGGVVAITDDAHIPAMMRVDDYVAPTWPEAGQPTLWRVMLDPVGHPFCLTTVGAD